MRFESGLYAPVFHLAGLGNANLRGKMRRVTDGTMLRSQYMQAILLSRSNFKFKRYHKDTKYRFVVLNYT